MDVNIPFPWLPKKRALHRNLALPALSPPPARLMHSGCQSQVLLENYTER